LGEEGLEGCFSFLALVRWVVFAAADGVDLPVLLDDVFDLGDWEFWDPVLFGPGAPLGLLFSLASSGNEEISLIADHRKGSGFLPIGVPVAHSTPPEAEDRNTLSCGRQNQRGDAVASSYGVVGDKASASCSMVTSPPYMRFSKPCWNEFDGYPLRGRPL
jgi:hypothetical protein